MTVSPLTALALLVAALIAGFIAGCARGEQWRRQDYEHLDAKIDALAEATGHTLHRAEPQPAPSWPQRIKAWAVTWWASTAPTPADVEPDEDVAEEDELLTTNPTSSELVVAPEPDPSPDTGPIERPQPQPGPRTRPDLKAASQVPPPALLTDEEWERKRDAMVAEMLAEIRGTK